MNTIYLYVLLSYLLGAIPTGYLLTRLHTGKNILKIGSGNIGSTNVKRVAGKKTAILTQVLDMFKGALPVGLYLYFYGQDDFNIYGIALATIVGHDFSIFLRFNGGKGVNTTLGASLLLAPYTVFISVGIYYLVKWKTKYVSLGSIILSTSLPIAEFIIHGTSHTFYYLIVCMILIILRHKDNIHRLLYGVENQA